MPKVIPYKGVRPRKDKVNQVVSKSIENYSSNELKSILNNNPDSFLHILKPKHNENPVFLGKKRFPLVKESYLKFKKNDVFIQDKKPSFYIYQIKNPNQTFCGILAASSTEDYKNNKIKKHENTLHSRKNLFKEYLNAVRFNAEPVLLTYPDNSIIDEIIDESMKLSPEYKFSTTDGIMHTVWVLPDEEKISQIQKEFDKMNAFYIADGHHRCASSHLLAEELKSKTTNYTGNEAFNYFLSYLIPESNLKIFEFNRLIKDLNGLSKDEFLTEISHYFQIQNRGKKLYKPSKKHHFCMYLDRDFYSLYLKKSAYKISHALSELDPQILYETILAPILNIKNLRDDTRIMYIHDKNSIIKMKELIDEGKFTVAFGLVAVSVEEIKKIANKGLQMPPKSTYIEPKLLSALTIYEL